MRVLHYIKGFSKLSETFIYDLVMDLEKRYPGTNTVICFDRYLKSERPYHNCITIKISFLMKVLHSLFKRLPEKGELKYTLGLRKTWSRLKYQTDVVHCHFGMNGVQFFNAIKKQRKPILLSFHGTDILKSPKKRPGYVHSIKSLEVNGTLFTVPSRFLKNEVVKLGISERSITVVENSVNDNFLFQDLVKRRLRKIGEKLRLASVGRLVFWKGHEVVIRALAQPACEGLDIEYSLVGDGDQLDSLKQLVKNLNLEKKVYFHGKLAHSQLPEFLLSCDAFLQPSIIDEKTGQTESFGVAVAEALCLGLTSYVSDIGGLPEVVRDPGGDFYGTVIPPGNVDLWARKIAELFYTPQDAEECQRTANWARIRFHPDRRVEKIQSLYKELNGLN